MPLSRPVPECTDFAMIQCAVSLSFLHFSFHSANRTHDTGAWFSSPQWKQKAWPQRHLTVMTALLNTRTARLHRCPGHQRIMRLSSTYERTRYVW